MKDNMNRNTILGALLIGGIGAIIMCIFCLLLVAFFSLFISVGWKIIPVMIIMSILGGFFAICIFFSEKDY
jgi:hypothetical protein